MTRTAKDEDRKCNTRRQIADLRRKEYLVGSNQGTYSSTEGQRATGSGEPRSNDVLVYETVGGAKRWEGCSSDRAPGRIRWFRPAALIADRARLVELEAQS